MNNHDPLYLEGFIRVKQILEVFPVSQATWFRGVKSGKYPQPIKLSDGVTVWKRKDVFELIKKQTDVHSQTL